MFKKFLLQALVLVLFAAFAMASSQKDYDYVRSSEFREDFRQGWNSTAPEEWRY